MAEKDKDAAMVLIAEYETLMDSTSLTTVELEEAFAILSEGQDLCPHDGRARTPDMDTTGIESWLCSDCHVQEFIEV